MGGRIVRKREKIQAKKPQHKHDLVMPKNEEECIKFIKTMEETIQIREYTRTTLPNNDDPRKILYEISLAENLKYLYGKLEEAKTSLRTFKKQKEDKKIGNQ